MKPKHTPGPWAIGLETDDTDVQIINAEGQHVAKVSIDPLMPTASLIACAPELLSALRKLSSVLSEDPEDYADAAQARQVLDALRSAEAVINKATT